MTYHSKIDTEINEYISPPHKLELTAFAFNRIEIGIAIATGVRYKPRIAVKMLEEVYKEYSIKFDQDVMMAPANSLTKKSKKMLGEFCKRYENPSKVDPASKVMASIEVVKDQMGENIAGMLDNMEKADQLNNKTDKLNEQADVFKKQSKAVKHKMQWANSKTTIILIGVAIVGAIIVIIPIFFQLKQMSSMAGAASSAGGGEAEEVAKEAAPKPAAKKAEAKKGEERRALVLNFDKKVRGQRVYDGVAPLNALPVGLN